MGDPRKTTEGESTPRPHRVRVTGLPSWIDHGRLLGPGDWSMTVGEVGTRNAVAELPRAAAAGVAERLRKVGLGGVPLRVDVVPDLPRSAVRAAKLVEAQRRRDRTPTFTRSGVRLDDEGRFSLTPEVLADHIASRVTGTSVVDACCGAGGNAIAFARAGRAVTAIELDSRRLAMAQHNAKVYGVADRIHFIRGDALEVLPTLSADLLFLDPPWGEDYDRLRTGLDDLPLVAPLLRAASASRFPRAWLKAPPSFDPRTVDHVSVEALFGEAPGDRDRVKMLWLFLR